MKIKEEGGNELIKMLNLMPEKSHRKAVRAGINAGSQVIVSEAKKKAKQFGESYALQKALTKKVFTDKKKNINGIVGADKNKPVEFNGKTRNAANYLHIVEFGHIGPDGNYIEGNQFLSEAARTTQSKQLAKFEAKTKTTMDKETLKLADKLGTKR